MAWSSPLYQGQCKLASRANFWLHLLINILASALFAASSYVMQRLAAPTRQDVENAHWANRSLKIGTLAVTNFALMSPQRFAVFLLLWGSSLPIHLMFNSLIEYTTTNAEWSSYAVLIDPDTIPQPQVNPTMVNALNRTEIGLDNDDDSNTLTMWLVSQQPALQEMDVIDCIDNYSSGTSIDMGDLLLVAKSDNALESTVKSPVPLGMGHQYKYWLEQSTSEAPWQWMCVDASIACQPRTLLASGNWMIQNRVIDHCLVRQLPQVCELNMSLSIMIAVLACNIGKLCAILIAAFLSEDQPLVTIGDAVSSFLENQDLTTTGISVADARKFPGFWDFKEPPPQNDQKTKARSGLSVGYLPKSYSLPECNVRSSRNKFVFKELEGAYSWSNLIGLVMLCLAFTFFAWTFTQSRFAYSNAGYAFDFQAMWEVGVGNQPPLYSPSQLSKIMNYHGADSKSRSYIAGAILANLPQLALSFLYLVYNNLFTRLFMALEFQSFSIRKGLRVSSPVQGSKQRGTYFLQFPLRYSLVFISYFVLLHTFLSESLFLRRTKAIWPSSFSDPDAVGTYLVSRIGYSPLAIFIFAVLLFTLVAFSTGLGLWRTDWVMPCTNGDSRSISAACHSPPSVEDAHLAAIRWGVTSMALDGVGHCSFSTLPIRMPKAGEKFS